MVNPTLKVNADGIALVEYTTQAGRRRHVLVWGAINAIAHPTDAVLGAAGVPDRLLGRLEEPP